MNRRQAKKAFKKKYGVNPGEVWWMIECILNLTNRTIDAYVRQFKASEQLHEDSSSECDSEIHEE